MEKDETAIDQTPYIPTAEAGEVTKAWREHYAYLKHYFTIRQGWIGDYDYLYRDHQAPFYGLNNEVPILSTIILGFQHALSMIGSIVSPPLAIAGRAFYFDSELTEYLVSASFIVTGIATALQVTRVHIKFIGTGLLSVVGPTFDILAITDTYSALRYAKGKCTSAADGSQLPCPEAWRAVLGSMLCTVWIQILMSMVPPRVLKRLFPRMVTGSLLLLVGVYLINVGVQNRGGSSSCHDGTGYYELCPNIDAPKPLPWGDPKLLGIGFSVFATIIVVEILGSPLMRSSSVIFGLGVGCAIAGGTGYWSPSQISAAPVGGTFLWKHKFPLSVDGALILPLIIMFACEAVSCMPDILATAEISGVEIEGERFNSRVQGGILCDGLGSLISALATGPPMVSQAGNNGVIVLTGCASRRAGWCASAILILMGIFGKFGALFASMPPSVLGGMQVFLYATITVAGLRVLAMLEWTRRERFILTASLGIGFIDIVQPNWFDRALNYSGSNTRLAGFEEGLDLIVETSFIICAVIAVVLNLILPKQRQSQFTNVDHRMGQ